MAAKKRVALLICVAFPWTYAKDQTIKSLIVFFRRDDLHSGLSQVLLSGLGDPISTTPVCLELIDHHQETAREPQATITARVK